MGKKPLTPEQKKALVERLAKARAAKQAQREAQTQKSPQTNNEEMVSVPRSQLDDIIARLNKVENAPLQATEEAPVREAAIRHGRAIGLETLYPVDKGSYFDPTNQLSNHEKLAAYGFKENFLLKWDVVPVTYETKWGVTQREPRFEITLYRRLRDEYMEPTGDLIIEKRGWFFEDDVEVERAAADAGIPASQITKDLYDEVRYKRIENWLLGIFFPPKVAPTKIQSVERVIDGKVVEVISAEAVEGDQAFQSRVEIIK